MLIDSRFRKFFLSLPHAEDIDGLPLDANQRKNKIADYFGMNRKIILEQKFISQHQFDKIQAEVEKFADDKHYPFFYGTRDVNLVLDKLPNGESIKNRIYNQITKVLEDYLKKANRQIASTEHVFALKKEAGVLVVLNEHVKELSPEVLATRFRQRLSEKRSNGQYRFCYADK